MIDNYKIKNKNNEEVLFLYINYSYEFGNFNNNKRGIIKVIKDYIKEHRIDFNGTKIKLVVSGIVLCTLILSKSEFNNIRYNNNNNLGYSYVSSIVFDSDYNLKMNNTLENEITEEVESKNIEENIDKVVEDVKFEKEKLTNVSSTQNNNYSSKVQVNSNSNINSTNTVPNESNNISSHENNVNSAENSTIITLYRTSGEIVQMNLNDYLVGVVAAEMPASFGIEALKTQAIVARTYTLKLLNQNKILTDNSQTQNYKDETQLRQYWEADFNKYYNKVKQAVYDTNNIVITYNNNLIDAVYHSTSNGYTEDALNVWGYNIPYLKQVDSSFDQYTTPYYKEYSYSYEQISNIIGMDVNSDTNIVIYKNNSNRVSVIYLDGIAFTGVNFRNLLNLRSADFDVIKQDNSLLFITRGYGHGVGLSQYGANYLANQGYNYSQIIKYYYTGVVVSLI